LSVTEKRRGSSIWEGRGTRIQQQSDGYEQTAELGRKKVVRTRKQLRNREEKDGEEEEEV
jgi:hypothetical protein